MRSAVICLYLIFDFLKCKKLGLFLVLEKTALFFYYEPFKNNRTMKTSVKIKFRASTVTGKAGRLYFQVIHNRVSRLIRTDYRLFPSEWDARSGIISPHSFDSDIRRGSMVQSISEHVRYDKIRLNKIIHLLEEQNIDYTTDDIISMFNAQKTELSFFNFMQKVISRLKLLGKVRTSETYTAAFKSFSRFCDNRQVMLDEMDSDIIMLYEAYLRRQGVSLNTISFYMRILRATYNRAVEKDLIRQRYPFKSVYTGVEKTVKRALPLETIRQMKSLDLSSDSSLNYVRDLFLFSFYTRGMSFIDMAYLRKRDLENGVLRYRRRKTGQQLFIKWEECMQAIVDKHPNTQTEYLLPIIMEHKDARRQYNNALHYVNDKLKNLSDLLDVHVRLTMYVARHSWASIAKSKNIPISIISEGMGHDSEATTQIYLASLDNSVIDRANEIILSDL